MGLIFLLVSVGYSALYMPVRCVTKFLQCGSLETLIFEKAARESSSHNFYDVLGVCRIFRKFVVCTMHSEDCSLLDAVKVNLLRVARDTSSHRIYNACVVKSIFCTS